MKLKLKIPRTVILPVILNGCESWRYDRSIQT